MVVYFVILLEVFFLARDDVDVNVGYTLPCIRAVLLSVEDHQGYLNSDGEGRAIVCLLQEFPHFLDTLKLASFTILGAS
jgi:hypothetical protein